MHRGTHSIAGLILTPGQAPPDRSIRVDCRDGTPIRNVQDPALPPEKVLVAARVRDKYAKGAGCSVVNGPSGYYNCAGLVFASRRTQIDDLGQVWRILTSDGYSEVIREPDVQIGDIAVYAAGDKCEHVGLVVAAPDASFAIPRILSKFGYSIEVVHFAHDCPYSDFQRRYFRMRNYDIPDAT